MYDQTYDKFLSLLKGIRYVIPVKMSYSAMSGPYLVLFTWNENNCEINEAAKVLAVLQNCTPHAVDTLNPRPKT